MKKKISFYMFLLFMWCVLVTSPILTAYYRICNPNFENFEVLILVNISSYLLLLVLLFIMGNNYDKIFIENWALHFVPSLLLIQIVLLRMRPLKILASIAVAVIMAVKATTFIKVFFQNLDEY